MIEKVTMKIYKWLLWKFIVQFETVHDISWLWRQNIYNSIQSTKLVIIVYIIVSPQSISREKKSYLLYHTMFWAGTTQNMGNANLRNGLKVEIFTWTDAPLEEEQWACASLASHVVFDHERAESGERSHCVKLYLLKLSDRPLARLRRFLVGANEGEEGKQELAFRQDLKEGWPHSFIEMLRSS